MRESNSLFGDYSLFLSYGGYIFYYRLFYENERFFIDFIDEKKYKLIIDFVVDVFNMFCVIDDVDGYVLKEEKKKFIVCFYVFKFYFYKYFKWCVFCGGFMWGIKD